MRKQHPTNCVIASQKDIEIEQIASQITKAAQKNGDKEAFYLMEEDSIVYYYQQDGEDWEYRIPILQEPIKPEDIKDKHVFGSLPLHLACLASRLTTIKENEFAPYYVLTPDRYQDELQEEWNRSRDCYSKQKLERFSNKELLTELARRLP